MKHVRATVDSAKDYSPVAGLDRMLLEKEIDKEFHEAFIGLVKLPIGVKLGVYSAYLYYIMLFKKIKRLDVDQLLNKRVRISNYYKFYLLLKSVIEVKVLKLT